jgi:ATP-dependent 26S proteasome regulatory subunit
MYELDDLVTLIKSRTPIVVVETTDELRILDLLKNASSVLKKYLYRWSITEGLVAVGITPGPGSEPRGLEPTEVLREIWNYKNPGVYILLDFHPFLNDPRIIRLIKEIALKYERYGQSLVFISNKFVIPDELQVFAAKFELKLPDDETITNLVSAIARRWSKDNRSQQMIISPEILKCITKNLSGLSISEIEQIVQKTLRASVITEEHVAEIIRSKYTLLNKEGVLSYEHDTARFSDVGGLLHLKEWLQQRQSIFLQEQKIAGLNIPKGILLLGIQGSGKSLAAKAVAGTWSVPLLRLDFGTLYDKYIGETERKTRESLKMAERMAPCVLWMDEIEKGIALETNDGGVSRRILSTLLTWMAERKSAVFLVATANDIQTLPPELMRKGRFDEIFFVDLPDAETRKDIFTIHLKKRSLKPEEFDLDALVNASVGFSGSEIEQAVVSGLYSLVGGSGVLTSDILLNELRATRPLSVVMSEKIEALREWARDRTVMAN